MKTFAAWTVIILGVIVLVHATVLALGGPSLFGSWRGALVPAVSSKYDESPLLGRIGAVIVPFCVGALALAGGCRMLSAENRGSRKRGEKKKAPPVS